jgi:amino acid adenylation domain-containing protein
MNKNLANIENIYRLAPLQEVMLFQSLYAPESGAYMEQVTVPVAGAVDIQAVRRAWEEVLQLHSVFRTSFFWEDLQQPVQVVHRQVRLPWVERDLAYLPLEAREQAVQQYLAEDRRRGFDLSRPPLTRLAWFRMGSDQHCWIWTFHHAILDGWSVQIVLKKVTSFYLLLSQGLQPPPERIPPYGNYIEWLGRQDAGRASAFWRSVLSGIAAPTRLNVDRDVQTFSSPEDTFADELTFVPTLTTLRLKNLAGLHRLTLNTFLLGAWAILLARYSNEPDVLFGTVVSGRPADLPGVEDMVGMFMNALPMRVPVDPKARLVEWLRLIQAQQLESRRFEYSHPTEIQGLSDIPRGVPMYETVVVFQNFPVMTSWDELKHHSKGAGLIDRTNLPLTVMIIPASEILIKILYNCRRFDADAIKRMLGHLRVALDAIALNPDCALGDVPILTGGERKQLLDDWNNTKHALLHEDSVVDLFQAQQQRTPDAVAFICGDERITYAELNARANRLAHHLQALGVGPEVLVGLCIERSFDFVVALLAIFKAGGAYLPLDPAYPRERLEFMLKDAGVTVLVTLDRKVSAPSDGLTLVRLDADHQLLDCHPNTDPRTRRSPQQLAYVIYTSGSTGQPKGVEVEHMQVLNRLHWMWEAYPFQPGEVACQKTAANFVDSIWELLGPLLKGVSTVIVRDDELRDASRLVDELSRHKVTRLWLVPSLLRALLDFYPDLQDRLPHLAFWVTSGEALTPELFARFRSQMPRSVLYNLYGTSEVWDATWFDPSREIVSSDSAPIGRPIFNMQAYVLDSRMQPVPVGVPGELHIGGVGLARGYRNRPDLTDEKLVPNPFGDKPGARLYKTGDSARFRSDGNIEFLGRLDHQVKIRGYRIELGEIEAVLPQHPAVRQAVVMVRDGAEGETRIVAYVVPRENPGPDSAELRRFIRTKLPEHMVPAFFVRLDAIPLTPNGKVDRRLLPPPDGKDSASQRTLVAPRNETERILAGIWCEILGQKPEQIGVYDHFFTDLGGHSLLATQLVSRVRNAWQVELPLRRLFESPTIDALAQEIDSLRGSETLAAPGIQRLDREGFRVTRPE